MKAVSKGPVVVIPLTNTLCDVYTGEGWENWSRFRILRGTPILLKGDGISEQDYKALQELIK